MKKKMLSLALASTMSLSAGVTNTISVIAEDQLPIQVMPLSETGSGTSTDPYQIVSADQLRQFCDLVNSGKTDSCAVLMADINLNNQEWTPIGKNVDFKFSGTFDGNGHIISGLYVKNENSARTGDALFRYVSENGTIKNVSVNGTVDSKGRNPGGIVGDNQGTIENCINKVNVTGDYYSGGIAGQNYGRIINCINEGTMSETGTVGVGGIAGYNYSGGSIQNCINIGEVKLGRYGFITNGSQGTVANSYFLNTLPPGSTQSLPTSKSSEAFSSGEVCWLLQNGQDSSNDSVWGQQIGEDKYPVLKAFDPEIPAVVQVQLHVDNQNIGSPQYGNPGPYTFTPKNPGKYTYKKINWYTNEELTQAYTGVLDVDQNSWKANLYGESEEILWTVTFNSNGGTFIEPLTVENGKAATRPADPTRAGYRFTGWYRNPECTNEYNFSLMVLKDLILYAGWIPTGQTITFDPNGGTFANAESTSLSVFIQYGSSIDAGQNVSRLGYQFRGWSTSPQGEVITETNLPEGGLTDSILYAQWEMLEYFVVLNDGYEGGSSQTKTYTVNQPLDLNQFTPTREREGYRFDGWYFNGGTTKLTEIKVTDQSDPLLPLQIYAHWKADTRDINYILVSPVGSETTLSPEDHGLSPSFTFGDGAVSFNHSQIPEEPGYTFAGWYASRESVKQITMISDQNYKNLTGADNRITLYGRYSINTYKVTFDANGGSFENGTQATQEVPYNSTVNFDSDGFANPIRNGYTFAGWWTEPAEGVQWLSTDTVSIETTLYAHWTLNSYPIKFDANGGQLETQPSVSFDIENGFISQEGLNGLPVPVLNGYAFSGWKQKGVEGETFTDSAYIGLDLSGLNDGQTIALSAQWQVIEYTITFNSNGGSQVSPVTYTIVSGYNGFPIPQYDGYTFLGWYDEAGNLVTAVDPGQYGNLTLTAKWQQNEQEPENPDDNPGQPGQKPDQPDNPPDPSVPDSPSTDPSEQAPEPGQKPNQPVNPPTPSVPGSPSTNPTEPTPEPEPEEPEPTPPAEDPNPDGITEPGSQIVENEDGSSTTWTKDEDGVQSAVDKNEDGTVTDVWVSIPDELEDETVDIPMEAVPGDHSFELSPDISIESKNENVARIPVEEATPGTVLAVQQKDGSWSIVNNAIIKNGYMYFPVKSSHSVKIYNNTINFSDIPADYPFYKEIQFVASRGIMQGLGYDNLWGPGLTVDRGMFAMTIWKLYNRPTSTVSDGFNIPASAYYAKAIQWINAQGLMTGYSSTDFGANIPVTREEIVTVLWRMYGSPVVNLDLDRYPDVGQIGPYALPAMKWAYSKGIIQGMENGELAPGADSKRYEIAILLYRMLNSIY